MSNKRKIDQRAAERYQSRRRRREPAKATGSFATVPGQIGARLIAAGALGSVAMMAMHAGPASGAAPHLDHTKVTSATLTADGLPGAGAPNAGFVTPIPPLTPTQFGSGSPAPKAPPNFSGVTQDNTLSTNIPSEQPLSSLLGIPLPSVLPLNASTSRNDPSGLGFGNFGVAPQGGFTVNTDGNITATLGFTGAVSIPGVGGGSFVAGFPLTWDKNGNFTSTQFDKTAAGIANLFGDPFNGPSNTTNTLGFAADRSANPNLVGNFPGGTYDPGNYFPGGPLDKLSQMLMNVVVTSSNNSADIQGAAAVNQGQQTINNLASQFPQWFSNSSTVTPSVVPADPLMNSQPSDSIGTFRQDFTLSSSGGFAFTPPAAQTLPGLPIVPPLTPPVLSPSDGGGAPTGNDASLGGGPGGGAPVGSVGAAPNSQGGGTAMPGDPSLTSGTPLDQQQVGLTGGLGGSIADFSAGVDISGGGADGF